MSDVVTENPLNRHVSWEGLQHDLTPVSEFFCRNHNPFPEPPELLDWAGRMLSVADLADMPQVEHTVTLECAGNGRTQFSPVPPGTPWGIRGMSTGQFRGVALQTLLEKLPPPPEARHLIYRGADRGKEGLYERSLSLDDLARFPAFVALRMNGEPLPPQHGAPFRMIIPGYYAMASIKWLCSALYSPTPSRGYFQAEDYMLVYQGQDAPARPATTMRPKSIMVHPREGEALSGPRVLFSGKAWSGEGAVTAVELEIEGPEGTRRLNAELGRDMGPYAWRSYHAETELATGSYVVRSFCHAGDQVQPRQARWNKQGYESNSAHQVLFQVG
jgi:DMSO/TMAO reductase YedYZ molybdopterin-dependent catalytic subunit